MEFWLIRHGSTEANKEGRLQGTLDFPLSSKGEKEALFLGERLKEQPFSLICCSDLQRARQTATLICSRRENNPKLLYSSLIREYDWGFIQGCTKEEIKKRFPAFFKNVNSDLSHAPVPGAEGADRLFNRAALFYKFLRRSARKCTSPVLVVSHGRFLHAFILFFLRCRHRNIWPFSVSTASLSILEEDKQGGRRIRLFNDVCHLSPLETKEGK